jgi:hypothetical protein
MVEINPTINNVKLTPKKIVSAIENGVNKNVIDLKTSKKLELKKLKK